jgi:hypothetical protein
MLHEINREKAFNLISARFIHLSLRFSLVCSARALPEEEKKML